MTDLYVFNPLTNEPRKIIAGGSLTIDESVAGQATFSVTGSGGSIIAQDEGSPIVALATALNFVGSGVVVTDGGAGVAVVTIAGSGTIDGIGSAGRVAVWTDADTLTNDAGLTYDTGTNKLTVAGAIDVGGITTFNAVPYTWPGADGTAGFVLSTDGAGALSWAAGGGAVEVAYNYLINGGGDFFQRQAPGTLTSKADDVYAGDRWYVLTQTAAIETQRTTGDTHSPNAHRLKQNQAGAQRMGYAQIIEYANSFPMRSRSVRFQARIKCSASQAIRIAILEWTGTADGVTSDVVNDWTNATFTAGQFFNSTTLTVTAVATVTPGAATWADISATATLGASVNNVIVLIWTEGTAAQNVTLDITEAGLYFGASAQSWSPPAYGRELTLCQRYYCKSFAVDTAPVQASGSDVGLLTYRVLIAGTTAGYGITILFPVEMRIAPTLTYFSQASANTKWRNLDDGADSGTPGVMTSSGPRSIGINNPQVAGDGVSERCGLHWSAEAEL